MTGAFRVRAPVQKAQAFRRLAFRRDGPSQAAGVWRPGTGDEAGGLLLQSKESNMLTGSLLWLLGVPIPVLLLIWFFFLRGR